jgi:hypothetical protein
MLCYVMSHVGCGPQSRPRQARVLSVWPPGVCESRPVESYEPFGREREQSGAVTGEGLWMVILKPHKAGLSIIYDTGLHGSAHALRHGVEKVERDCERREAEFAIDAAVVLVSRQMAGEVRCVAEPCRGRGGGGWTEPHEDVEGEPLFGRRRKAVLR